MLVRLTYNDGDLSDDDQANTSLQEVVRQRSVQHGEHVLGEERKRRQPAALLKNNAIDVI